MIKLEHIDTFDFGGEGSQQFATVIFDRDEDAKETDITVIRNGKIRQFKGDNKFNPSARRHSSCVYVTEEVGNKNKKICTIQHKGVTFVEIYDVSPEELKYLFGSTFIEYYMPPEWATEDKE